VKSGRRKVVIISAALTLCIIAVSIPIIFKADSPDRTTDTWSHSFSDMDEKLAFFEEYLIAPSEVLDVEYHIEYHDNSKGAVPGPSDWDIRAALKIKPEDISLWTDGFSEIPTDEIELSWWDGLKTENISWEGRDFVYYQRPESISYLVVFPDAGVILKSVSTMMLCPAVEETI